MKKHILAVFALLALVASQAKSQSPATEPVVADSVSETVPEHLCFQDIPIAGSIDEFTELMKPRYQLKKKIGGDQYFIFYGSLFGYDTYLQVSYTRKSRTVYKVMATPKSINQQAWIDSLTALYGDPIYTDRGWVWQRPEGMIVYYTPEGYDSALIYLDYAGQEVFRKEK